MLFREKRLAQSTFEQIKPHLKKGLSVLDLGAGSALAADLIQKQTSSKVKCLDVVDISRCQIKPIIFNGRDIPFKDNTFDLVICCFVLHHTPLYKDLLCEMKRVSKDKILILEDVPCSWFDWPFLFAHRALSFFVYHSRKMRFLTDNKWQALFSQLNLKLVLAVSISRWRDWCMPVSRRKYLLAVR